jgi:hypothetical protein
VAPVRTIATTMSPVTCTANGMGIVESVDTIGPGDSELLMDASRAGLYKMVSANHTGATEAVAVSSVSLNALKRRACSTAR